MTYANYVNDVAFLGNTPIQAAFLQHRINPVAGSVGFFVSANYIAFKRFQQKAFSTLNGKSLRLLDLFTYLGSNISSIESGINIRLVES